MGAAFVLCCDWSYVFGVDDIFVFYILLFVHLKVFCFLMQRKFQKIQQKVCVLRLLVCLLVYVLCMCYRFLSIERKEIR